MVRKIDADLRLSRATGTIQLLATHPLADFEALGAAGQEASAIAKELIASCETRIQLAQDTKPLNLTREAIGLTDAECDLIGGWGAGQRGRALWKVGRARRQSRRAADARPRPRSACSRPTSGWWCDAEEGRWPR